MAAKCRRDVCWTDVRSTMLRYYSPREASNDVHREYFWELVAGGAVARYSQTEIATAASAFNCIPSTATKNQRMFYRQWVHEETVPGKPGPNSPPRNRPVAESDRRPRIFTEPSVTESLRAAPETPVRSFRLPAGSGCSSPKSCESARPFA